ncbi:flagellar hook-basal body complex protein FliE [Liquorilactobacillus satsumensis]|uniref:Flagellar hook-basal body complex protein FliE n=2 Tax=Liquorilactobacillus satsumensis TaxID=259059 RepID=A0A0R1V0X7_9LACO|nr:flagellar hook-basal body complex protein FliE [Liquorilactobacillus satsumensis]AJA34319.1 flagellar hook-basal body complex protein FliE [Liquorilactobacillus satsumensis]KRL99166.1 hypothetical protein FD50_GL000446 [Liquorilactobacillus satsumensis DSM 16230 = JCM 12392]MCC7666589.1 flagellar hook-basal body complex protein FliE [Liquorilactobacillus satsumensis]MCP9312880.1 flagellar hook-basal body complex protein FliE [Liquorilactobacillus satsumensis]MCP9329289.1 flagellar hook-basa
MDGLTDVSGIQNYQGTLQKVTGLQDAQTSSTQKSFSSYLNDAVSGLNQNVNAMNQSTADMVSGKENSLGNVMIKMTEAQLSLQTAVQVRNKCLDAYNDIKNMQF